MRKEVEALKQARVIYAGRSESAGNGGAVDLAEAVTAASHVSARLMQAGILTQEDWEYVVANDLRPAFLTGPDGKMFRRELFLRFESRVTKSVLMLRISTSTLLVACWRTSSALSSRWLPTSRPTMS